MEWNDVMSKMAGSIARGTIDFSVKNVHRAGAFVSFIGGAGLSFAQSLHKPVDAAYYVGGEIYGDISVNTTFVDSGMGFQFKLPLNASFAQENMGSYNLNMIADPQWMQLISTGMIGMGVSLRVLGGMLKKLQQHWEDKKEYPSESGLSLSVSSSTEHVYNAAGSFIEAASLAFLGHSITTILVNYTALFATEQYIHYPSEGILANGTYYQGPLASGEQWLNLPLEDAIVPIWGDIKALFQIMLEGDVTYLYGGGFCIKPSEKNLLPPPVVITFDLGAAFLGDNMHTFFAKREAVARQRRIKDYKEAAAIEGVASEEQKLLLHYGSIQ